jgi:hypothetical protein
MNPLFSALEITWDPMIRGFLIVAVAVLMLVGSVYLLLATNTGLRTGFFLAAAGLSGMLLMLCVTWTVYGLAQGPAGRTPSWECIEIATDSTPFTSTAASYFPEGFTVLDPTDSVQAKSLGDASAAADKFLVTASNKPNSHGEIPPPPECSGRTFTAPFATSTDYLRTEGLIKGGERGPMIGEFDWVAFWHAPKFAVIEVQQVLSEPNGYTDVPRKTAIDPNGTTARVLMVRDLGSRRFPTFVYGVGFGILFALTCYHLHRREKQGVGLGLGPNRGDDNDSSDTKEESTV